MIDSEAMDPHRLKWCIYIDVAVHGRTKDDAELLPAIKNGHISAMPT